MSLRRPAGRNETVRSVRLDRLSGDIEGSRLGGDPATDVTFITRDSAAVRPGTLFCCLPGHRVDGHDFAPEAVASGAVALLCERPLDLDVSQVVVTDARVAMAPMAAALYEHPSRRLAVAGVTGTNGKTTTTLMLEAVLETAGRSAGVIGTLSGARTTPEADELQALMARMAAEGRQAVAMEVSSHALAQHRVDATWFSVAVFTNLSQDHLDFHGSMEEYFRAKASLFDPSRAAAAVVNADDPHGRLLLQTARIPTRPFSRADAVDLETGAAGSTFGWEGEAVTLRLGGTFNVMNALAAAAAARELGVEPGDVAAGLSSVESVPGRFEPVDAGQAFTVVVDYAHTPAGLEQALTAARQIAGSGRVVTVFGCGGDRDRAKRPAMGEVATRLADLAVLTTDNPRSERPEAIAEEVQAGAGRPEVLVLEPDRRAAIALAFASARPSDVVVIAGKGHETTQIIGGTELAFDDREVAREELHRMAGA